MGSTKFTQVHEAHVIKRNALALGRRVDLRPYLVILQFGWKSARNSTAIVHVCESKFKP